MNGNDKDAFEEQKSKLEQRKKCDMDKDNDRIRKAYRLIKGYKDSLEPPSANEANFMLFKQGLKIWYKFTIEENILVKRTIKLKQDDKNIISGEGFKVIQTPHSNRVFLIGGNDHPFDTYEFDLKRNKFFPQEDEDGMPRIFMGLRVGRSHHSLAATSGMIICTGGHPDHLKDSFDQFDAYAETNPNLGRVIEVFKLKDKMWITYSEELMNSRFWHSSCIMGNFLYLIHGYDATNSILNSLSIERIKIKVNEADFWGDQGYRANYAIKNDDTSQFFRCFNPAIPCNSGNRIIYFGYKGLENDSSKWLDQTDLRYSSKSDQKVLKCEMVDELPRYYSKKYELDEDKKLYKKLLEESSEENSKSDGIDDTPLEGEYTHNPVYFRGLYIMPILQDEKLTYYDDKEKRFKDVPNVKNIKSKDSSESDSDSDSD